MMPRIPNENYPMMMSYEVRALERLLLEHERVSFAEWGAGRSTLYFTQFLEAHNIPYTWISIEHNLEWFKWVQEHTKNNKNIFLFHIPKEDMHSYVTKPQTIAKEMGITFDIALVDGIFRNECLTEASQIAKTVLLHDAQRKSYITNGTFLAGRLLKVGKQNRLSRIHVWYFRAHEQLWKLKQFFFGTASPLER